MQPKYKADFLMALTAYKQQSAYFEYLGDIFEKNGFKLTVESNNGRKINNKKLEKLCRMILMALLDLGEKESNKKSV